MQYPIISPHAYYYFLVLSHCYKSLGWCKWCPHFLYAKFVPQALYSLHWSYLLKTWARKIPFLPQLSSALTMWLPFMSGLTYYLSPPCTPQLPEHDRHVSAFLMAVLSA